MFREFLKGAGRRQKGFFESAGFDEIRAEVKGAKYWHGFNSVEAAYESVGGGTDYLHLYDSFSPFVHDANLDHDFSDYVEGKVGIRALPQRDPKVVQLHLRGCVLVLLRILDLYSEDEGAENCSTDITVTFANGDREHISPVQALHQEGIAIWGAADGWAIEDADVST